MAPGPTTATPGLISGFMNADSFNGICPRDGCALHVGHVIYYMIIEPGNRVSESEQRLQQWIGSIQARSGDLAASEAKVVDLLLTEPLFVGASTTAQVAARAGVSPPTVVRAARALGFSGFTELKIEIARARGTARFFAPPEALAADATSASVLETSIRTGTDALTALSGAIELSALDKAVDLIQRARRICIRCWTFLHGGRRCSLPSAYDRRDDRGHHGSSVGHDCGTAPGRRRRRHRGQLDRPHVFNASRRGCGILGWRLPDRRHQSVRHALGDPCRRRARRRRHRYRHRWPLREVDWLSLSLSMRWSHPWRCAIKSEPAWRSGRA